jgi:hypothetical protein
MATQYSPLLKLALPVTGELSGTWGDVVNDNITSMIEQAVAGLATINTWTANSHTLTTANGTTSESRCAMLVAADGTGGTALTAAGEIICPTTSKLYVVRNGSSYAVTLKTAAGTGIAVPTGQTAFLFCDGTNVNACVTTIVDGNISGNLTVGGNATINGNTTLGDATSDTITATARFNTDLVPSTDNARDLGSSGNSWKDLYIDGTAYLALVDINGGTIDGVSIGATTAATIVNVDNLRLDGNTLSSTDTNGNIVIAPNGTGDVQLDADTVRIGDSGATATLTTNGAGNLVLSTNSGTTSGTIVIANGANGDVTLTPDGTGDIILSADRTQFGDLNTDAILTTNGTGNLNLTTNNGTNSGTIQIAQGVNGAITLTPNGTGVVSVPTIGITGGTVNGVGYLNASKVLTTGSALTFDGTSLGVGTGTIPANVKTVIASPNTAVNSRGNLYVYTTDTATADFGAQLALGGSFSGTSEAPFAALAGRLVGGTTGYMQFSILDSGTVAEQMRLTSTGLGIGTSSPATGAGGTKSLEASGPLLSGGAINAHQTSKGILQYSGNETTIRSYGATSGSGQIVFNIGGGGGSADSEGMRLTNSGNVGIGTSSPETKLHLQDNGAVFIQMTDVGDGASRIGQNGTALTFGVDSANGATERMRIDSSGNLGLGVTPSAWSGVKALQVGSGASLVDFGSSNVLVGSNLYFDGSNNRYINTDSASYYQQNNGAHAWATAPSGTAGNAISFTQAMTLDASGRLGVGATSPATGVQIRGTTTNELSVLRITNTTGGLSNADFDLRANNDGAVQLRMYGAYPMQFFTSNAERMRLDSSGNLGLGVSPSAWGSNYKAVEVSGAVNVFGNTGDLNFAGIGANLYHNNTNYLYRYSTLATMYLQDNGTHQWHIAPSGTAGNAISFTQAMTLDASGNLLVGGTSSVVGKQQVFNKADATNISTVFGADATSEYIGLGVGSGEAYLNAGGVGSTSTALVFRTSNAGVQAERARITSAGDVGIGTASPRGRLDVRDNAYFGASGGSTSVILAGDTTTTGGFLYQDSSQMILSAVASVPMIFRTANTEKMRISSAGNVGIGTTSPTFAAGTGLQVKGAGFTSVRVTSGALTGTDFSQDTSGGYVYVRDNLSLIFGTNDTERARIDSSGNLLVGTTVDAGYKFRVAGGQTQLYVVNAADRCLDAWNSAASGDNEFVNFITEAGATKRGSITYNRGAGLVAYNTTSDYRAKDITGPLTDSGSVIDSVPVYMGKMKGATQERPMFIAHEVPAYAHTGVKDAVDADGKPVYQQMDASALIPVMWAEIQSLRARIAALESQ